MGKTNTCYQLELKDVHKKVVLIGWVSHFRDHGGKKFVDLRDKFGTTQIVFENENTKNFLDVDNFRREFLLKITGVVRQ